MTSLNKRIVYLIVVITIGVIYTPTTTGMTTQSTIEPTVESDTESSTDGPVTSTEGFITETVSILSTNDNEAQQTTRDAPDSDYYNGTTIVNDADDETDDGITDAPIVAPTTTGITDTPIVTSTTTELSTRDPDNSSGEKSSSTVIIAVSVAVAAVVCVAIIIALICWLKCTDNNPNYEQYKVKETADSFKKDQNGVTSEVQGQRFSITENDYVTPQTGFMARFTHLANTARSSLTRSKKSDKKKENHDIEMQEDDVVDDTLAAVALPEVKTTKEDEVVKLKVEQSVVPSDTLNENDMTTNNNASKDTASQQNAPVDDIRENDGVKSSTTQPNDNVTQSTVNDVNIPLEETATTDAHHVTSANVSDETPTDETNMDTDDESDKVDVGIYDVPKSRPVTVAQSGSENNPDQSNTDTTRTAPVQTTDNTLTENSAVSQDTNKPEVDTSTEPEVANKDDQMVQPPDTGSEKKASISSFKSPPVYDGWDQDSD